ncbi:MAG: molybdate ABC transporter substrate-binding protein, partial [Oscillospiraceae bacterium]|nr:molybdate ABC transporter substrate-binding protein [Oscillospiraceae bacterium]
EAGLLMADSRFDILENKVVLSVPNGNPANIYSFDDLTERLQTGDILLAMGNCDVPVGQYTQKIFDFYGVIESEIAGNITYATNVKEITTQVAEGSVDCGIVYATDAASANLTVVDAATAQMCGQVIYPAAIVKNTAHEQAARDFLEYLTSDEAGSIFASVGFTPLA